MQACEECKTQPLTENLSKRYTFSPNQPDLHYVQLLREELEDQTSSDYDLWLSL